MFTFGKERLSSVGRASASQVNAHEYEPCLPLESETHKDDEGEADASPLLFY